MCCSVRVRCLSSLSLSLSLLSLPLPLPPPSLVFPPLQQMLQMTISTRIILMYKATLCFVRLHETDINPLFLLQTDKSMEWRCHTCRQWRGQLGFDSPAKALLLPVTVRALQIGNPEEIICKEHVHRWCRIQRSHRGEMRKKPESKQPGMKRIKALQTFSQNTTKTFSSSKIPNSDGILLTIFM